jgi:hypothetical protein
MMAVIEEVAERLLRPNEAESYGDRQGLRYSTAPCNVYTNGSGPTPIFVHQCDMYCQHAVELA